MRFARKRKAWLLVAAALALAAGLGNKADASTFNRVDLDYLVAQNGAIVVGDVVDARSYWNDAETAILTDFRVAVAEVLKGSVSDREITVTVPGGQIGELRAVIVGAADLVPGRSYVLFLDRADLFGAHGVLAVQDHCQGVFDLETTGKGVRAVSQARRYALRPDATGHAEPVGGAQGIPFTQLVQAIRQRVERAGRPEVQR